jgi:hypothetical protein
VVLSLHNLPYEREAERVIAERWEAQRQEQLRRSGPHPLVVGPLAQIPIPERKQKPKRQRQPDSTLTPSQQELLRELMDRARKQERK